MSRVKYFILPKSLTIVVDAKTYHVNNDNPIYSEALSLIKSNNTNGLENLIDFEKKFGVKGLSIKDGLIKYKDELMPSVFGDKLNLFPKEIYLSLINFYLNILKRSDLSSAKKRFILMMERNAYPITEDGFILVYNGYDKKWYEETINKDFKEIPFYSYSGCIDYVLGMFDKRKNLEEICLESFGFFSKNLKKIVVEKSLDTDSFKFNSDVFKFGLIFKSLLNSDKIFFLIKNESLYKEITRLSESSCLILKEILSNYREEQVYTFLNNKEINSNILYEIVTLYSFLKDKKVIVDITRINNFIDLLNYLKKEVFKLNNPIIDLKIKENFPLVKEIEISKKLSLSKELTVVIPENNMDLLEWSKVMGNCINGYTNRILRKDCFVLGIYSNTLKKIVYNVEIVDYRINQFVKKYNSSIGSNNEHYKLVYSFLKENKLIK